MKGSILNKKKRSKGFDSRLFFPIAGKTPAGNQFNAPINIKRIIVGRFFPF
jgi:hypothetical protein